LVEFVFPRKMQKGSGKKYIYIEGGAKQAA
jgi:hypothetical protein